MYEMTQYCFIPDCPGLLYRVPPGRRSRGRGKEPVLETRAEIGRERRRQIQVRTALESGLAGSPDAETMRDFYLAVGKYISWSMARLHDQDQGIHDRLKERLPETNTDEHRMLDELNARQQRSRSFTADFERAVASLRQQPSADLQDFVEAARAFAERFRAEMAPRRNPFEAHTNELFSEEDWRDIAAVSEESLAEEEQLFEEVRKTAPAGNDPANVKPVHG